MTQFHVRSAHARHMPSPYSNTSAEHAQHKLSILSQHVQTLLQLFWSLGTHNGVRKPELHQDRTATPLPGLADAAQKYGLTNTMEQSVYCPYMLAQCTAAAFYCCHSDKCTAVKRAHVNVINEAVINSGTIGASCCKTRQMFMTASHRQIGGLRFMLHLDAAFCEYAAC